MKKAITILAVLIVLVGAVFAETHTIRLKTVVDEVIPAFQLSNTSLTAFKDVDGVKTEVANVQQYTNPKTGNPAEADEFAANGDHTYGTESRADVNVGDLSKYDVTVGFTVYVANKAKTLTDYRLTFTAGSFAVERNGVSRDQTLDPKAAPAISGLGAKNGTNGEQSVETSDKSTYVLVDFNGNECVADTPIAIYTVQYDHDASIDPKAAGYFADITLGITTN
jgi:hypothetical protein